MAVLPVQTDELTARARILRSALELVASRGAAGTSVRAIAEDAEVSPALVVHHFGSKAGLLAEVDAAVLADFRRTLDDVRTAQPGTQAVPSLGPAVARLFGHDPVLRAYLRRSLVEDDVGATTMLDELLAMITDELAALADAGHLRERPDAAWTPYQVLFVTVGPLLLEPVLQRHVDGDAFSPDVVEQRSRSSHDFVAHGIEQPRGPTG